MLLVCMGPDSYRALAKAKELERAFIEKHDPSGVSVERIEEGAGTVEAVMERVNTPSLFSPKRFIRVSDLMQDCPKAKQKGLIQALSRDPEHVIVASAEREPPAEAVVKLFSTIPKYVSYDFPIMGGKEFLMWSLQMAARLGVTNQAWVQRLAESMVGDSWRFVQELQKCAAGAEPMVVAASIEPSIFQYAEAFLRGTAAQRAYLRDEDALSQVLPVFATQTRSALRVRDGAVTGLHPYVVKKLQTTLPHLEEKHGHLLLGLFLQRSGYGSDSEAACVL